VKFDAENRHRDTFDWGVTRHVWFNYKIETTCNQINKKKNYLSFVVGYTSVDLDGLENVNLMCYSIFSLMCNVL
jgi:hypothetical protein